MASRFVRLPLAIANRQFLQNLRFANKTTIVPKRTRCHTETGALYPEPSVIRFGSIFALGTALPFLLLGSYISMEFAALLEEHDLFVPDDDDDD